MSNAQNTQNAQNETKASAAPSRPSSAPDGKSKLPDVLPDFPGDPTKPGPSSGPVPK